MAIFWSSVSCCEENDSVQESFGKDSIECSVTLRCAWGARLALISDVLGNRRFWPYASTDNGPWATKAVSKPASTKTVTDGQGLVYIDALVTINYSTREDKEVYSETLEPTVEFLQLDHKTFRWTNAGGDPVLEGESPGKLMKGVNYNVTFKEVEPPLPDELLSLMGCVNNAPVTSPSTGLTFDTETLLFNPPTLSHSLTAAFHKGWSVGVKYSHKAQGWNKFWRSKTGTWERMVVARTGAVYNNYPLADFSGFVP